MEINSSDFPALGCVSKCGSACKCSRIARLFGSLMDSAASQQSSSVLSAIDDMLLGWGCKTASCCVMASLYSASSFGFIVEELSTSISAATICDALRNIVGIEHVDVKAHSQVVSVSGREGVMGRALNMLLSMGCSVSKIILDEKPSLKSDEGIEMGVIGSGYVDNEDTENSALLSHDEQLTIISDSGEVPCARLKFKLGGLTCASCSSIVMNVVSAQQGVIKCDVALMLEELVVVCDPALDPVLLSKNIVAAIEEVGFTAKEIIQPTRQSKNNKAMVTLNIGGMTCASCVNTVETALGGLVGVSRASVNLISNIAVVEYDERLTGLRNLIEAVSDVGFEASVRDEAAQQSDSHRKDLAKTTEIDAWREKFLISVVFTLPLILLGMGLVYIPGLDKILSMDFGIPRLQLQAVLSAALATPVQFYCGWGFYVKAYRSLRARAANMEVLVSMGSTVAYLYSIFAMINAAVDPNFPGHHFFETSAALICFVLLGRYLETMAKGRTSMALVKLLDLRPKTAVLVRGFGEHGASISEEIIPSHLVQLGDILKITPGSTVPADGEVVEGSSSVDESMITGESLAVAKSMGSKVIGGTINNEGLLYMKATRVGADSTLSQIVKLVEEAQTSKAPIQAFADRVTGVFVPVVVAIAVCTFLIWFVLGVTDSYPASWRGSNDPFMFALMFGISVLVISCPCALGLATPTAVMVGTGVGANLGILIKGGRPLEMAKKINAVLFDKTGTLTIGKLQVTDFAVLTGDSLEKLDLDNPLTKSMLSFLGSAESASEHPIGKAIVTFCRDNLDTPIPRPTSFQITAGRGLMCLVNETPVLVGNRAFLQEKQVPLSLTVNKETEILEATGKTCVFVCINSQLTGYVALSDVLKPEAHAVINILRKQGSTIYMVTGDNNRVASHIGKMVGLPETHIFSEVAPAEKRNKVQLLQKQGYTVCFVGDGINDSIALSQADMGIALGTGTDIAMECADIVLMRNNLKDVATAIDLSRATFHRIKLNFLWAFIYNILAIPLAAGLFFPLIHVMLPPIVAGFAMALSSTSVVMSSLLLHLYKKPVPLQ